jgi:multiple sugar transport system substrate-binding protein
MRDQVLSRRRLVGVLGLAGAGALLAACSAAATPTPAPAKPAEAPKPATGEAPKPAAGAAYSPGKPGGGTISWLVRSTPQETKGQEAIFEPAIKQALPNVQINRIIVPIQQYVAKINSMAAAKENLDLWGFGGNYYDYWARGMPQDLTGYISADSWDVNNYFQQGLMDIYKVRGKYYGVSQLTTFGSVMAFNRDMFDKAGLKAPPVKWDDPEWTWDRMIEYATKMTKNPGKPDAEYGVAVNLWNRETSLPYLFGGDCTPPEHYTNTITPKMDFANQAVIDGHQARHDLIYKHKVSPDPATTKAMEAIGSVFRTSKLGMDLDGGWLFWQTSDIKDFKLGYAALPKAKTNKHINFNDFWIMGRWSTNKDAAWQVMRVITDVPQTTAYAIHSGTPPTPRASLRPWLENVSKYSNMSVDDLVTLTTGAIDPKNSQESSDHHWLQFAKINDAYDQEIDALWTNPTANAKDVLTKMAPTMDNIANGIYNQFKDSLPKD